MVGVEGDEIVGVCEGVDDVEVVVGGEKGGV